MNATASTALGLNPPPQVSSWYCESFHSLMFIMQRDSPKCLRENDIIVSYIPLSGLHLPTDLFLLAMDPVLPANKTR
jgi:hypothetical protein